MKPLVSNPALKPKFFWFHLKPEQINWVMEAWIEITILSFFPPNVPFLHLFVTFSRKTLMSSWQNSSWYQTYIKYL